MANYLQLRPSSSSLFSTSSSSSSSSCRAAISVPKRLPIRISLPKFPTPTTPSLNFTQSTLITADTTATVHTNQSASPTTAAQLYAAVMEAVADRIEMHHNVSIQRDNWNSLLLSSINMSILAASTITAASDTLPSSLGSTILFSTATALLSLMNAIQPSQLAEEQRNATRLFKQLHTRLQQRTAAPTQSDVDEAVEKVLALDRAYPLPLLGGKMVPKFPSHFKPAQWWPQQKVNNNINTPKRHRSGDNDNKNGWSEEMEREMRHVAGVVTGKDKEDYVKLGTMVLKLNKALAVTGPTLTGVAAAVSAAGLLFGGGHHHDGWTAAVAVGAGALAAAVNTLEHGGQMGMVAEMYRNCAGFFDHMEECIEGSVEEGDFEKRENGRVLELKVGLALGRSPAQVRELAARCRYSEDEGTSALDEFASKLF